MSTTPFDTTVIGASGSAFELESDIKERQSAERARQDTIHELQNAKQANERFLSTMGHELRSPLNAIIGFAGLLMMKMSGPLNSAQEGQLKLVEESANQLLSLIDDLLDLAKMESDDADLHLEPVPCQGVIDEVIASLMPLAEQKQLELVSLIPDREVPVRTDRGALTQILLKLTSNALKFTERGVIHIKLKQHDDGAGLITEISVADTGIGIRAKDQHRLFQAFQKFRGNGKVVQPGNGLGLHVSQKLAKLLGGESPLKANPIRGAPSLWRSRRDARTAKNLLKHLVRQRLSVECFESVLGKTNTCPLAS